MVAKQPVVEGAFFKPRFVDTPVTVERSIGLGKVPGGGDGIPSSFPDHPDGIETEKQVVPEVLQAARRPHSDFPAQDQAQVERRHMNQQPLQDVPMPPADAVLLIPPVS